MRKLHSALYALVFVFALFSACTDPTDLGAELLKDDQAIIGYTDTLSIRSSTLMGDSIETYSPVVVEQLSSYIFGKYNDPVFGQASSSIYVQPWLRGSTPDFTGITLDSVVLVLPYDTLGFYGMNEEIFGMEVFEVLEDFPRNIDYFSNDSLQTDLVPLGTKDFLPSLDTIEVFDYNGEVLDTLLFPHLRVPLNLQLGERFIAMDSTYYETDSLFLNEFKGIKLSPTVENSGLVSFDLRTSIGGIYVYYTRDTIKGQYQFPFSPDWSPRFTHYEHDYTGAPVEPFIDGGTTVGDSLIFLQGLEGLNVRIEFPYVTDLKGLVINKAELELSVASLQEDAEGIYDPVQQLLASTRNEDGDLQVIEDIALSGSSFSDIFGGVFTEGDAGEPDKYILNISTHFQRMIDGGEENFIDLSVFGRSQRAFRVPFYGAGHQEHPIKIRITYTEI